MTVPLLHAASFDDVAWLRHGFTTRAGGVSAAPYDGLNLGRRPGEREEALVENWARVAATLDPRLDARDVALVEQVHGGAVLHVDRAPPLAARPGQAPGLALAGLADALVTTTPGVVVAVRVADCVPVLLCATSGVPAIAAVHAGWRGVAAEIVAAAVATLTRLAGSTALEVRAAIGPHIGPDAFEVGDEVVAALEATGVPRAAFARPGPTGRPHVDLAAVITAQLAACGVTRVERVGGCTTRDPRLWSHRRDGERGGRQAAALVIAP